MDRTPADIYDDGLIRQIFRTTRAFSRSLNGKVAAAGIHSSEWTVLNLIYLNDGMSQAELIAYLAVEPAAVTRTLMRLEKKGIIRRESLSTGRGKFIRLTPAGKETCETLEPAVIAHRRHALACLSRPEREQLMELMGRIFDGLKQAEKSE